MTFPSTLPSIPVISDPDHQYMDDVGLEAYALHNLIAAETTGIAGKVGVDNSADTTSIDYKVRVSLPALVAAAQAAAIAGAPVQSVAGRTGDVTLAVADVSGAAPSASPALTGAPTAPTASPGTNTTQIATTAFAGNAASTAQSNAIAACPAETASTIGSLIAGTAEKKVITISDKFSLSDAAASNILKSATTLDIAAALYKLGFPRVIWQSGIPFILPGGDGGANGLSLTGTRGVFTMSAAILSGVYAILGGCYLYLPAGAGGLGSSGWRWATFSDDTNGEVFQDTYTPGSGVPAWVSSPTQQPNLTAGRITQTTSEITAASFTQSGGWMGPNGVMRDLWKFVCNNSAGQKSLRIRIGGVATTIEQWTTTNLCTDGESVRQNIGVQNKQIGNRPYTWLGYSGITTFLGDSSSVDTSSDQTVTMTLQLASNVDSLIGVFRKHSVTYGA
mgnify:CR=1 FL=1